MSKLRIFSATCLVCALVGAAPALARESGPQTTDATRPPAPSTGTSDEAANTQLGEIIVTAQKRKQSILNVPVIESVVSRESIRQFHVQTLKDVATLVPGLMAGGSIPPIGEQVSLRGVGTTTLDPGIDQSVSLNIDGLQLSQGLAYQSAFFDMGQIQVLEGPQSLFYGTSSIGGVISIRTADPTDQYEAIAEVGYEYEANQRQGEIILSGPISHTVKARLAAEYSEQDGYFNNLTSLTGVPFVPPPYPGSPDLGAAAPSSSTLFPDKNYMIRATVLWNPTDTLGVRLKVNEVYDRTLYSGTEQLGQCVGGPVPPSSATNPLTLNPLDTCKLDRNMAVGNLNPAAFPGGLATVNSSGIPYLGMSPTALPSGLTTLNNNGVPFLQTRQTFGTLEVNYRLRPDLTLTSVTGYYRLIAHSLIDDVPGGYAAPLLVTAGGHLFRTDRSEELRVNSDFSGPLNFTAGAYFARNWFDDFGAQLTNTALTSAVESALGPATSNPLNPSNLFRAVYQPVLEQGGQAVDITTNSGFAQLRYKIVPKIELAAGARYTSEKRTDLATTFFPFSTYLNPSTFGTLNPATFVVPQPELLSRTVSPEVTVTYKATPDMTLFAALKRGYQSGSFNTSAPATGPLEYGPERAQGGELGLKSRWLDDHLAVNLSAFDYRYTGLQVGASIQVNGNPITRTLNAGAAESYGLEGDFAYRPRGIAGLQLNASAIWNHARFLTLDNVPCYTFQTVAEGCNENLNPQTGLYTTTNQSGVPMLRAPDFEATFGFDWTRAINQDLTFGVASSTQFSSRYLTSLGYLFYQPSFFKTNLSLRLDGPSDRWQVAVIGKNLNDVVTAGNCDAADVSGNLLTGTAGSNVGGPFQVVCWPDRGREMWLRLTVRFIK